MSKSKKVDEAAAAGPTSSPDLFQEKDTDQPAAKPVVADKSTKATGYKVAVPFRDQDDFDKLYKVGENVSHFDKQRLEKLIALNCVVES